jgi:signal transduction histidine kinase
MGITNLLELEKDDPETLERCTTNLKSAVHSLDSVVKDLSKILTITDGSVELTKEKVDLTLILNNIKTDLEEVFNHSKAKVEIPTDSFFLFSHKAYLYSIFYNLVSNAIKYKSKHHPEIHISVSTTSEYLLVSVSDNGIGIDLEKNSEDLFKPYKRFNLAVEGKGLGLFLVKSHVESLNGTITIDSKLGAGTTFTIKLPFNSNQDYINN